jgi:hypothetical protein
MTRHLVGFELLLLQGNRFKEVTYNPNFEKYCYLRTQLRIFRPNKLYTLVDVLSPHLYNRRYAIRSVPMLRLILRIFIGCKFAFHGSRLEF